MPRTSKTGRCSVDSVSFLTGMLAGSALVVGAMTAYGAVLRRRRVREIERRSKELVALLFNAVEGKPTPNCDCPSCTDKRSKAAAAERKN